MKRNATLAFLALCLFTVDAARGQSTASVTGSISYCTDGQAAGYACGNIDMYANLSSADMQSFFNNDIWGWTDRVQGRDYALVGRSDGVAFVDVTDPVNPVYVGDMLSHDETKSVWRDMKVYKDYMFVVVDGSGANGVQIFDLTQLRNYSGQPIRFNATARYAGVSTAHNIVINEETGYAYVVGSRSSSVNCGPGLHIVDIRNPQQPEFAGCFADTVTGRSRSGYTHDAQCVTYKGPDTEHFGKEICFGANETHVSVADVTNKADPVKLAAANYPDVHYTHQGWLTADHKYFIVDDELDEIFGALTGTRTLIWDVIDLDDPILYKEYFGTTASIDHNQYVHNGYIFQANYSSGLRIIDIQDIKYPEEVAFFDTHPDHDGTGFDGAWSVYPFFESGTIVVNSQPHGLFVLAPTNLRVATASEVEAEIPSQFTLSAAHPNPFNPSTSLTLSLPEAQSITVVAYDLLGRYVALLHSGMLSAGEHSLRFEGGDLPSGSYLVRATSASSVQTQSVTLAK